MVGGRGGEGAVVKAKEFLIHNCVAKREVFYKLYRMRKEADLAGYKELLLGSVEKSYNHLGYCCQPVYFYESSSFVYQYNKL